MAKKLIGLRISEEIIEQLDEIAKNHNISTNQMAITAITEWLHVLAYAKKYRLMVLPMEFFSKLLKLTNDEEIRNYGYEMAIVSAENMREEFGLPLTPEYTDDYMKRFPEYLTRGGLLWFEDVKIHEENGITIMTGFHHLGVNFSKFFTYLTERLLTKYFNLEIVNKTVEFSPNSVYIESKKKSK
ncbi:MAG: hypothetical protein ACTSPM_13515 [Candidatus Heimdallarchaeota archaeon]